MEKKKKPGRPRTRPLKPVGLRCDVTPAEAEQVRRACESLGESQGEFTRRVVVRESQKILKRK